MRGWQDYADGSPTATAVDTLGAFEVATVASCRRLRG